jgi:hypothetical protein
VGPRGYRWFLYDGGIAASLADVLAAHITVLYRSEVIGAAERRCPWPSAVAGMLT